MKRYFIFSRFFLIILDWFIFVAYFFFHFPIPILRSVCQLPSQRHSSTNRYLNKMALKSLTVYYAGKDSSRLLLTISWHPSRSWPKSSQGILLPRMLYRCLMSNSTKHRSESSLRSFPSLMKLKWWDMEIWSKNLTQISILTVVHLVCESRFSVLDIYWHSHP